MRRVYAANPRTVVVLITSFPVALPWAAENATTILHMTHASQELGNAPRRRAARRLQPGRAARADLAARRSSSCRR